MLTIGDIRTLASGRTVRVEHFGARGTVLCTYCTKDGMRLDPPELHEVELAEEFLLAYGKEILAAPVPSG